MTARCAINGALRNRACGAFEEKISGAEIRRDTNDRCHVAARACARRSLIGKDSRDRGRKDIDAAVTP